MADRNEVEGLVVKYVALAYGVEASSVTPSTPYESLGRKSTGLIKISALLEDELDMKIPVQRLMKNESVADTVDAVVGLLAEEGR
jgi:acyl carrier protein